MTIVLNASNITTGSMVDAYNRIAAELNEKPVARFADRKTAMRRLSEITTRYEATQPKKATIIPAALAQGVEKAPNCRRSLDEQAGKTKPRVEPEVAVRNRDAAKAAPKAKAASAKATKGSKIILKANKEVRAALTAACKKLGGSRLIPGSAEAGATYTDFLGGFDPSLFAAGEVTLSPVGGKGVVILTIADLSVSTAFDK